MNDTDDEHAILTLAHAAHAAHTAGQHDTAGTLLTTLTTSYEMAHIAAVMCQRDTCDRIGAEAALLQLFGATMLYGHTTPPPRPWRTFCLPMTMLQIVRPPHSEQGSQGRRLSSSEIDLDR